ncbi:hypothetical protein [Methylomagnum sp.]
MSSLRTDPEIKALFKVAECRHLTDDEYRHYLRLAPDCENRVLAAQEVAAVEATVIRATLVEIFQLYPYVQHHFAAQEKCVRDVTYVSIYATHTMLLDDPAWFRDKLLLWLRTILQAFEFPARNPNGSLVNPHPEITRRADGLPPKAASIYDTYSRLQRKYQDSLSPASFALMREPLQQPCDVLALL